MTYTYQAAKKRLLCECPDLAHHRRRAFTVFFVKLVLLELLVAAFTVYLCSFYIPLGAVGLTLALLLPFPLLKPQKIFKRRLIGEVTEVGYRQKRVIANKVTTFYNSMADVVFLELTLQTPKGKTETLTLEKKYEKVFAKGDVLILLSACSHPITLTPRELTVCPRCATVAPLLRGTCITCEFTLPTTEIKPQNR